VQRDWPPLRQRMAYAEPIANHAWKGALDGTEYEENANSVDDLTEEQLLRLQAAFSLFDGNGDGQMDIKEMRIIFNSLGQYPSEEKLEDIMDTIDTDGSATISFEEFKHIMYQYVRQMEADQEIKEAFKVFDKNGNGFISAAELRDGLNSFGEKLTDEDVEELVKEADQDLDGKLNYEEFYKIMTREPDPLQQVAKQSC